MSDTRTLRDLVTLVVLTIVVGLSWMAVVPSFEGPDELFFYNRAREYAEHPTAREPLFYRAAGLVIRAMSPGLPPAEPRYNPAFRFTTNRHGEVNRFSHERLPAPRSHLRTLAALRVLVLALSLLTVLLIYAVARLALPDARWAVAVAAVSLAIPQFSFVAVVVHPEVITRLVGAAVALLVAARAAGRLSRGVTWVAFVVAVAVIPFADRQAFFLVPFAAAGLVAAEPNWRARLIAAGAMLMPALLALAIVARFMEDSTNLGPWFALLRHPLNPLVEANPSIGSVPPERAYYAFEFAPKLFMGFWGWLGQPSILLPAWLYGVLGAATGLALAGLISRLFNPENAALSEEARRQRLVRRLLALGVVLMCIPILYAPAIAGRNLWYGRWLFAMLGAIVAGLGLGWAEIVGRARRRPHRVAAAIGVLAIVAFVLWVSPWGDAFRAGVQANHYGDRERLIATARDLIVALAATALAIELAARAPRFFAPWSGPAATVACACALNVTLLASFVKPLYEPLTPAEFAVLIDDMSAPGESVRAADIYASATTLYPDSIELRRLGDSRPRLLLGSQTSASGVLLERLARASGLADREVLLRLAREAAGAVGAPSDTVRTALADAEQRPDLAEPARLLRLALEGGTGGADVAAAAIAAGDGMRLSMPLRQGEARLEGRTLHRLESGGTEVIVYFTPLRSWDNHRVWLRAYPIGSGDYLDPDAAFVQRDWPIGVPGWEVFHLPPGRYELFAGVWVGGSIGDGVHLGSTP